jgi:hypothetical protein
VEADRQGGQAPPRTVAPGRRRALLSVFSIEQKNYITCLPHGLEGLYLFITQFTLNFPLKKRILKFVNIYCSDFCYSRTEDCLETDMCLDWLFWYWHVWRLWGLYPLLQLLLIVVSLCLCDVQNMHSNYQIFILKYLLHSNQQKRKLCDIVEFFVVNWTPHAFQLQVFCDIALNHWINSSRHIKGP